MATPTEDFLLCKTLMHDHASGLSGYVPYTGATGDVNLGIHQLMAGSIFLTTDGQLTFRDANQFIKSTNAGYLSLSAFTEINLQNDENNILTINSAGARLTGDLTLLTNGGGIYWNNGVNYATPYIYNNGYDLHIGADAATVFFHAGGGSFDFSDCDENIINYIRNPTSDINIFFGNGTAGLLELSSADKVKITALTTLQFSTPIAYLSQAGDGPGYGGGVPTVGIRSYGFDDKVASYINMSVEANGHGVFSASGNIYFSPANALAFSLGSGGAYIASDKNLYFGSQTADQAAIQWDTAQTKAALLVGLDDDGSGTVNSRTIIFCDIGDMGYNFAHTAQTNPTIFVHSAAQSTTQWTSITHDGTDGVIDVGAGNIKLDSTVAITSLTAGRIPLVTTAGLLTDSADFTWLPLNTVPAPDVGPTLIIGSGGTAVTVNGIIINPPGNIMAQLALLSTSGAGASIFMGSSNVLTANFGWNLAYSSTWQLNSGTSYNSITNEIVSASAAYGLSGKVYVGTWLAGTDAPAGTPSAGGSIPNGTYYYTVTCVDASGKETTRGRSTQSAAKVFSGGNGTIVLTWTAVAGSSSYKVYRTTASGVYTTPTYLGTATGATYTDTAAATSAGAPPEFVHGGYASALGTSGLSWVGGNFRIGCGLAGTDYTLTFDGETNDGVLTWMEDEDYFQFSDDIYMIGGENIVLSGTTGTKIGTATSQLLGFYNATPVDQPATVADPSGGVVVDAEARTAINSLIDRLQEIGLIA